MEREQLAANLKELEIDFPDTATISQLRGLLMSVVGASNMTQQASGSEKSSANSANKPSDATNQASNMAESTSNCTEKSSDATNQAGNMAESNEKSTDATHQADKMADLTQTSTAKSSEVIKHYGKVIMEKEVDEIEQLQARKRILQLKKEIADLERQTETKYKSPASFADIENSLSKFTGDDNYSIMKWTKEFERITNAVACSDAEKFLFARRMMAGSANLFMRTSEAQSWEAFKHDLCEEFKRTVGAKEILKRLESRLWKKGEESLHRYVLIMQQIGEDAPIEEHELVEYIVEGLRDKSPAVSIFYNISTVAEFKHRIPKYEKIIEEAKSVQMAKGDRIGPARQAVRCYNCSDFGHYATSCTKEKRQHGTCFKCGKADHLRAQCPLKAVGAVPNQSLNWNVKPL
ncbi:uncharacterized protein [Musca autumnalis]|uniref:uncharacterized protein n=1 Tax=Musca autumnalis TaxID=221902 RepID=UPI003CE75D93